MSQHEREFHESVLKKAAFPLNILDQQINDYIRRGKE